MRKIRSLNGINTETVARRCSVKKVFLKVSQNSQENTSVRVSFLIKLRPEACIFIKKESLAQVFYCEFYKNFKKTFFYRIPLVVASVDVKNILRSSASM